jgi:hypothetical protein
MKRVLISLMFVLMFVMGSCGEKEAKPDTDIIPDEDAVSDEDSAGENWNDFQVEFDFKGLINTYEDVVSGDDTMGVADFIVKDGFGGEHNVSEYARAFIQTFKAGEEGGADTEYLRIFSYKMIASTADTGHYYTYSTGISTDELKRMKAEGESIVAMSGEHQPWATFYEEYVNRKKTGGLISRSCILGMRDVSAKNLITVDNSDNTEFAAGENIITSGKLSLIYDEDAIRAVFDNAEMDFYEDQLCAFYDEGTQVTKAEYEKGLKDLDRILSCELPEDFNVSVSDSSAVFEIKAIVNQVGVTPKTGTGNYKITVNEEEYAVSNYSVTGYSNQYLLYVQALGNVSVLGTDHYTFNLMNVNIPISDLKAFGDTEHELFVSGMKNNVIDLFSAEQKKVNSDIFVKLKPLGAVDKSNEKSFLYFCNDSNVDYSIGEVVEFAGNIALTMDAESVKSAYGSEETYCASGGIIPCELFDDVEYKSPVNEKLPEGFLETDEEKYFVFTFEGILRDTPNDYIYLTPFLAYVDGTVKTGTKEKSFKRGGLAELLVDWMPPFIGKDTLSVGVVITDQTTNASGNIEFDMLRIVMEQSSAADWLNLNQQTIGYSDSNYFVSFLHVESMFTNENHYQKECPYAVIDTAKDANLFFDYSDSVDFSNGKKLNFAGNIPLTTDLAVIDSHFGGECVCRKMLEPITCEEFDEVVTAGE